MDEQNYGAILKAIFLRRWIAALECDLLRFAILDERRLTANRRWQFCKRAHTLTKRRSLAYITAEASRVEIGSASALPRESDSLSTSSRFQIIAG